MNFVFKFFILLLGSIIKQAEFVYKIKTCSNFKWLKFSSIKFFAAPCPDIDCKKIPYQFCKEPTYSVYNDQRCTACPKVIACSEGN